MFQHSNVVVYSAQCANIDLVIWPAYHLTEVKEKNISSKLNRLKNPNWREADQVAVRTSMTEELN